MSATAPAVSIAIRAYRRRWLAEAIGSVLSQTYGDFELVVYDDAGDLEPVVDGFADDPRVRYVRADAKRGASGRFDAAVALCRGSYIGVLDDDDRYEPEFLERLVAALDSDPEAGVAFCRGVWDVDGVLYATQNGRPAGRQPDSARALAAGEWRVPPSRMLIRRRALDDADRIQPMPDGVSPDFFVNVRVAVAGWHHVLVDEALTVSRWHADQLTRTGSAGYDLAVATRERLRIDDPELDELRRARHASALIDRGLYWLREGDRTAARRDLRAAAEVDPHVGARRRRAAAAVASVPGAGRLAVAARQARRALHSGAGPGSLPPDAERGAGARSLRQVARDAGALALGGAAAQALTVLVAPILTRLYDPAAIGAAGVLTGAMAFVGLIACLRFDMAIPLARGSRAAAQVCGACVVTGVAVTAVAAVLAAVAGDDLCDAAGVPQVAPYVWLVPVHTAIASVGLVGAGLLMRRRRFAGLGGVRFAQAAGQSATQLGAGAAGAGAAAAWFAGGVTAGAAAASVTAATAGLAGLSSRAGARAREGLRGARQALRRWRRFAAWSSGAAALQGLALAVPTVLVAGLYGAHEAGLFVLTQRVLGLPIAVAGEAAGAAWFGTAAQIVREDRGSLREPLAAVTRTMLLVGGVAVVAIMVAGPPLFGPVFGDEWTDGGVLVLVLAPLHFSLFAAVPAGQTLQARGRTDLLMGVAAGRLLAPFAGIAGGHALGLGFTASVGLYAAAMALVSLGNAALAWRVSGTVAQ